MQLVIVEQGAAVLAMIRPIGIQRDRAIPHAIEGRYLLQSIANAVGQIIHIEKDGVRVRALPYIWCRRFANIGLRVRVRVSVLVLVRLEDFVVVWHHQCNQVIRLAAVPAERVAAGHRECL